MGQNSTEKIFVTKIKVVYISAVVHAFNSLQPLISTHGPTVQVSFLSSWKLKPEKNRNLRHTIAFIACRATWSVLSPLKSLKGEYLVAVEQW